MKMTGPISFSEFRNHRQGKKKVAITDDGPKWADAKPEEREEEEEEEEVEKKINSYYYPTANITWRANAWSRYNCPH